MERKRYLIDVPVQINIWIRENLQKEQLKVIKKIRPSILFVQSDGGRNEEEWNHIRNNRRLFDEQVDWDCQVHRLYHNRNLGMYACGVITQKYVWNHVDRCIFLEDDDIPAESFFRFCADMLEKYKDDTRIERICGNNIMGEYKRPSADYFFSAVCSIHGTASWRRVHYSEIVEPNLVKPLDEYTLNCLLDLSKEKKQKSDYYHIKDVCKKGRDGKHMISTEFCAQYRTYAENQLCIIPSNNLIKNMGWGEDAEHGTDLKKQPYAIRKMFLNGMINHELTWPLKEPKCVIRDVYYEKYTRRVLGLGHPVQNLMRNIEKLVLAIRYGDKKRIMKKWRNLRDIEER